MTSAFAPRSARALIALRQEPDGLRLSELANLNQTPLSSAQRLLAALIRDGLVVASSGRHPTYRLAPSAPVNAIEEIARWRLPEPELSKVSRFLEALRSMRASDSHNQEIIDLPESARVVRQAMLALLARRARPGAGSDLNNLRKEGYEILVWWSTVDAALKDVPHAVLGAIAAMRYMPARQTRNLDIAVRLKDLPAAEAALRKAGWKPSASLQMSGGLVSKSWIDAGQHELDVIGLPGRWGETAIAVATPNKAVGMRSLTLPYSVLTKMISSRTQDVADINRMLGPLSPAQLAPVLAVMRKHLSSQDVEDLEQIAALGRLEVGRSKGK
jgi:hypothetical protein